MKVAFVLPSFFLRPAGGPRVVYQYANQLVSRGHEVYVVHAKFTKNLPRNAFNWFFSKVFGFFLKYLKLKRKWQFIDDRVQMLHVPEPIEKYIPNADVVFATAWQTADYIKNYSAAKGRKFYLIQHYETWGGQKNKVDTTWRASLKKVVIAKWLYKKGIELGINPNEMFYVPNGIDHQIFKPINTIEKRPKRIAMMYSEIDWKGSADGIRALSIVREKYPDLQVIFFGVYPRPGFLPEWIEYRNNPPQKELVEDIYNNSIIFLCTSWAEGWPLPPAEAMACGCALVSTNCSGIDEYAENEITALLSPIRNPEALAANIKRLLENDQLRIQIAKRGCEKIRKFTWAHSTDLLEEFIGS